MSALAQLKLVSAKRPTQLSPIAQKRNKIIRRIGEQIELAKAQAEGRVYAPMKLRSIKDAETGAKRTIETSKKMKSWWWNDGNGKLLLSLRYGVKVIELAKGKSAIEIASVDDLVPTLAVLRDAVNDGELDAQIETVSGAVKAAFKK